MYIYKPVQDFNSSITLSLLSTKEFALLSAAIYALSRI